MSAPPARQPYRAPPGASVREMFGAIARRYDLLNRVLSVSIDRYWRSRTVRLIQSMNPNPEYRCLDLCTGTGDLVIDIGRRLGITSVGADFCFPMLERATGKVRSAGLEGKISLASADAMALPFPDRSFGIVTVAFGIRNVEVMEAALAEMLRVLIPGGHLIILEFSRPVLPVFRSVFGFYFRWILPRIGAWISGTAGPYQYLPDSVARFPDQKELAEDIEAAGFADVSFRNLTGGVAALHWGRRPELGP